MFSLGEVQERSMGAAPRGAREVAGGALKVRAPRLPSEEPPPARANASPEKASASPAASARTKVLWRNAMNIDHKIIGRAHRTGHAYMGSCAAKHKAPCCIYLTACGGQAMTPRSALC